MPQLIEIFSNEDIPKKYRDTAIGDLLMCHNFGASHKEYEQAELLVGVCMDHQKK